MFTAQLPTNESDIPQIKPAPVYDLDQLCFLNLHFLTWQRAWKPLFWQIHPRAQDHKEQEGTNVLPMSGQKGTFFSFLRLKGRKRFYAEWKKNTIMLFMGGCITVDAVNYYLKKKKKINNTPPTAEVTLKLIIHTK